MDGAGSGPVCRGKNLQAETVVTDPRATLPLRGDPDAVRPGCVAQAPALLPPVLPPVLPRWPAVLLAGTTCTDGAAGALARIRTETLFWPAPRSGAARPRILALDSKALAVARLGHEDADILLATDPAAVDPVRLERVYGPEGPIAFWARLGGIAAPGDADPSTLLARARGRSPWTGETLALGDAVEAQALLRSAALRARGPIRLIGMSRWKRHCIGPFLTGPDGPPRPDRPDAVGPRAVWGAAEATAPGVLRIEDGFLRSVGLGLRHVPPVSLAITEGPPHFDATQPNAFEATVAETVFTPVLLARAAALRARIVALGLTKYNVGAAVPLPDPGQREAILVPGQVAGDASIRLGARTICCDRDLLVAVRARFPDAFLLYKPHPDTLAGLRRGALHPAESTSLADATAPEADMAACLSWADRVATITSLTGFEALLRGKAVTTFGRPFYAGWGLTDDVDPPPRGRSLLLDELVAATLILHPCYVDPFSGLPCTPEVAIDALVRLRAARGRPAERLLRLWREAVSWGLNRLG
jgi:capsular polysaccharide export protein